MRNNSHPDLGTENLGAAYDSKSAINGGHFTTQTTTPPIVSANQIKACSTNNIPVLDQGWQVRLPKAPSCFLLNSTNGKQLQKMKPRKPQCSKTEKRWNNTCCKTVFFIGSGKCGSTSLALLLKHKISDNYQTFDYSSGIADGGKEPCLGTKSKMDEGEFYSKFRGCSKCHAGHMNDRSEGSQTGQNRTMKLTVLDACPRHRSTEQARK
ncbi:uncharacterized protein LOC142335026 [Convolutriloba macropyga]|uniref:uncharacterized protein LOC142335026 n=1 Tax=Convolutriloba macropyga TaxID=536237 RepID=UPI003F51F844